MSMNSLTLTLPSAKLMSEEPKVLTPEQLAEACKKYNKDKIKARTHAYYLAHRNNAETKARRREYYLTYKQENQDKIKAQSRKYYLAHQQEHNEKMKAYSKSKRCGKLPIVDASVLEIAETI